jgi:hypothetical protein
VIETGMGTKKRQPGKNFFTFWFKMHVIREQVVVHLIISVLKKERFSIKTLLH